MTVALDSFTLSGSGSATWRNPRNVLSTPGMQVTTGGTMTFTDGTGAVSVARLLHSYRHTIGAATRLSMNLKAGGPGTDILDPDGDALTFTIIRAVMIFLRTDTAAASLTIGGGTDGAGANAWANATTGAFVAAAAQVKIFNGAPPIQWGNPTAAGYTVAANNVLALYNNDLLLSATVDVLIAGE